MATLLDAVVYLPVHRFLNIATTDQQLIDLKRNVPVGFEIREICLINKFRPQKPRPNFGMIYTR